MWVPPATIGIAIKIITTLKMYSVYEISLERQEVTELCRAFLVRMRTGAFNPKRERKQSEITGQVTWHLV